MKAVVQRVFRASVTVAKEVIASIDRGLVVLLGVARGDEQRDLEILADKIVNLRIFEDDAGKMNLSLEDVGGEMLVVSQFTLLADTTKGRRPSFFDAMAPEEASAMVKGFADYIRRRGIRVGQGRFGVMMDVELVNQGPVTIILDSRDRRKS